MNRLKGSRIVGVDRCRINGTDIHLRLTDRDGQDWEAVASMTEEGGPDEAILVALLRAAKVPQADEAKWVIRYLAYQRGCDTHEFDLFAPSPSSFQELRHGQMIVTLQFPLSDDKSVGIATKDYCGNVANREVVLAGLVLTIITEVLEKAEEDAL